MPGLLSGSALRAGGSQTFLKLSNAQPQLPPTPTTSTGYTVVTSDKLVTSYTSSLGNIEFSLGQMYSNLPNQNINIIGTGTSTVIVSGSVANTGTNTGALIVQGGIGISQGLWTGADIHVNGLTIGQGYQGLNNIVIQGSASPQLTELVNGQESIVIGYDALLGLTATYKTIAIGRYALNSGTGLVNSIAIGDSALKNIGTIHSIFAANITNVSKSTNTTVTAPAHGLTTGTHVMINGVVGMAELNGNSYYIKVIDSSNFGLYLDINTLVPLNSLGFASYVSGGTVSIDTTYDNNIAIGVNAGQHLIDGTENFFLGHNLAVNMTTGSYNVLIGHDVANNMITGNANISLGGDQLVNGLDNQVSIGSLLYFNGGGYTQVNSDLGLGVGTYAVPSFFASTITNISLTNPAVVSITGGYNISTGTEIIISGVIGTIEVNDQNYFASYLSSTSFALYHDNNLTLPVDATAFTPYVSSGAVDVLEPYGALTVLGGAGINGNLLVTDDATLYGGLTVKNLIYGTITTATNLLGGALGSIPYQTGAGSTTFIPIGGSDTVLTSNGTTATWKSVGTLSAGIATTANNVLINSVTVPKEYYAMFSEVSTGYSPVDVDANLTYITTSQNTSSYFVTGTNVLNVPGSIYTIDGNVDENNLLYTPRIFISSTEPANPRVGDFWINAAIGLELQYINDGGNKIWIQFTGI